MPERRPYRIIALDLDGTLLDDHGAISPENAGALRSFAAAGGVVVLASGRMTDNIRPFYDTLGIDGPIIAYNGALARDSRQARGEVILHRCLPSHYSDQLLDYTAKERFQLNFYYDEKLYSRGDPELRRFSSLYSRQTGAIYHFLPDLDCFRGKEPTKLLIVTDPSVPGKFDPRHRDELYELWFERWGQEITVMRTNPEYLEFYHREVGKDSALAAISQRYRVDQSHVIAMGDSYNDISMLEWAGLSVAVANSHAEVKERAKWVSPETNNESAVAAVIEKWVDL